MPQPNPVTLVVEDNEGARVALVEILQNQGYEVKIAKNGKEALLYLRDNVPPDVIILDMLLPVVDGWGFLEQLKDMNIKPRPWIVVATGAPAISREWAADHGCGGFLRKPIEEKQLLEELQRCLSKTVDADLN